MPTRPQIHHACALLVLLSCIRSSNAYSPSLYASSVLERRDQPSCKTVDPSLPDNFKCASDQACVSLDSSSSALCCPENADCSSISPISCDVKRQNPATNPNSGVFTTKLTDDLSTCGTLCCPFGYSCSKKDDDSFQCNINADKARFAGAFPGGPATSTSSSSTSATSLSSTSSSSTSRPTTTNSASLSASSNSTDEDATCNPFPPGPFFAGLIPGIIVGALAVLLWVGYTGRAKKPDDGSPRTPQKPERRPTISDPIPTDDTRIRADFLRRTAKKTMSIFSTKEDDYRADSNPWKMPTPPVPNNIPKPREPPVTPTPAGPNRDHVPSLQTINIYTPPELVQHPSAAVSPLKTKKVNQQQHDPRFGSPFTSPARADKVPTYDNPVCAETPIELEARPASSVYNQSLRRASSQFDLQTRRASSHYEYPVGETLTPQRYEGDANKRDTSFTALMEHCNIPDSGDPYPTVPTIPEQYKRKK